MFSDNWTKQGKIVRSGLSQPEIKIILRTLPDDIGFHFYERMGKPTGEIARSLVDFRDKVNIATSSSLVFHLKRKDFEKWIKEVAKDCELAERISNLDPDVLSLKMKLHAIIDMRIKELRQMLASSTRIPQDVAASEHTRHVPVV